MLSKEMLTVGGKKVKKITFLGFLLFARRSADVVWFDDVSPRKAENDVVVFYILDCEIHLLRQLRN